MPLLAVVLEPRAPPPSLLLPPLPLPPAKSASKCKSADAGGRSAARSLASLTAAETRTGDAEVSVRGLREPPEGGYHFVCFNGACTDRYWGSGIHLWLHLELKWFHHEYVRLGFGSLLM